MTAERNRFRETMGRCRPCGVIYRWEGQPRRRDALCSRCNQQLGAAMLRSKERILFERPLVRQAEATP